MPSSTGRSPARRRRSTWSAAWSPRAWTPAARTRPLTLTDAHRRGFTTTRLVRWRRLVILLFRCRGRTERRLARRASEGCTSPRWRVGLRKRERRSGEGPTTNLHEAEHGGIIEGPRARAEER